MRKSLMVLLSVLMIFFTACGNGNGEGTAFSEVNVEEGITLAFIEDALKSSRGTFLLSNDTQEAVTYDTYEYHFEQMIDGQWSEFPGTAQSS